MAYAINILFAEVSHPVLERSAARHPGTARSALMAMASKTLAGIFDVESSNSK